MRISPGEIEGSGCSSTLRTPGPPCLVMTTAFIAWTCCARLPFEQCSSQDLSSVQLVKPKRLLAKVKHSLGRGYNQHCTLAHALDRIGERWTLLIVRELLAGPRRYTDLAQGLVTVPSNILASRLRDMEALGLVARKRLPPPAENVVVYELTEEGAALSDAIAALSRWGMRSLPPTTDGRALRARWLIPVMEARFDPRAAADVNESYQLQVDEEEPVHFTVRDGHGQALPGPAPEPAVSVSADAETLVALANGAITIPDATSRGARIEGAPEAIQRMLAILPPPTTRRAV